MLTLIHGDDTASSRNYLQSLKTKENTYELIDGEKVDITDLTQIFEGGGLFEEKKTLFLEQFISKKKQTKEYESILSFLSKKAADNDIFIWEAKEIEKSHVTPFKNHIVKLFTYPQTLFQFLDTIKPHNTSLLIKNFHTTLQTTEPEIIFFMLTRHIRILLMLKDEKDVQIDETKRLAPWQKSKLTHQAKLFSMEKLLFLHEQLFTIDTGIKSGNMQLLLATAIDFFLLEV
jgi:hypothetical protein